MSIPSTQILVSKYNYSIKRIRTPRKIGGGSRSGAGKMQDETEVISISQKEKRTKKYGASQKDTGETSSLLIWNRLISP